MMMISYTDDIRRWIEDALAGTQTDAERVCGFPRNLTAKATERYLIHFYPHTGSDSTNKLLGTYLPFPFHHRLNKITNKISVIKCGGENVLLC